MTRLGPLLAVLVTWASYARAQLVEPPRCPSGASLRCALRGYGHNEYTYTVDGSKLQIEYTDSGYFALKCPEDVTLDNSVLPRFESQLRVKLVLLSGCTPRISYAAVLGAFNVLVLDELRLVRVGNLTRAHFAGLEKLLELQLTEAKLAPGALEALPALRRLHMFSVRLPRDELLHLPRSLELLQLVRMNTSLPAAVLERLPALVNVTVRDAQSVTVEPAGALQGLALEIPAVRVAGALLPSLRRLTVFGWGERRPAPWAACAALDTLVLHNAAAEELPAGWLRRCGRLRVLHLGHASRLSSLDGDALRGARELQELRLISCALTALPPGLLDEAENLRLLDLSRNGLLELPGGLFARTRSLQSLYLSSNNLTPRVFASLEAVTSLTTLQLSHNIRLKDSCGGVSGTVRGSSKLQYLKQLTNLHLRNTSATMICRDWRESMPLLETLDLAKNNFTSITFADLQFSAAVAVDLIGNNVTKLYYTRRDYEQVKQGVTSRATVLLDDTLSCDCDAYWAARALQEWPAHVTLKGACASGVLRGVRLRAAPLDQLMCAAPQLCALAPPACTCAVRQRDAAPARLLRVHCERAGVTRVADVVTAVSDAARAINLSAIDFSWDLRLAHNRIAQLSVTDLPTHLSALDLRYNNLTVVRADAANALLADDTRAVRLAHNPLACDCAAADTLAALRARRAALADYDDVTCADLTPLARALPSPCPLRPAPAR